MKLCFVSENGARETYFVDAPRINGNTENLTDASKEVGLDANIEKTK
jgi:hypothetical protein